MFRLVLLHLFIIVPGLALAQLPERLEKCLPYPTFAQEVRQMQEGKVSKEPAPKRIRIQSLVLKADTPLPSATARRVVAEVKSKIDGAEDGEYLDLNYELTERVRDGLQHYGFFNAIVAPPQIRMVRETAHTKTVAVTLQVNPRKLYRLGGISFSHGTFFSAAQMRSLFPIRQGEIFDTHKLGRGIDALRKAYGEYGFINFAALPSTQIDESRNRISLVLDLDEGKQFRVSTFEILGIDPLLAQKLIEESGLAPGTIFNTRLLDVFFQRNKALLPSDASAEGDTQRQLDEVAGTVGLTIDVRGCPAGKIY